MASITPLSMWTDCPSFVVTEAFLLQAGRFESGSGGLGGNCWRWPTYLTLTTRHTLLQQPSPSPTANVSGLSPVMASAPTTVLDWHAPPPGAARLPDFHSQSVCCAGGGTATRPILTQRHGTRPGPDLMTPASLALLPRLQPVQGLSPNEPDRMAYSHW